MSAKFYEILPVPWHPTQLSASVSTSVSTTLGTTPTAPCRKESKWLLFRDVLRNPLKKHFHLKVNMFGTSFSRDIQGHLGVRAQEYVAAHVL